MCVLHSYRGIWSALLRYLVCAVRYDCWQTGVHHLAPIPVCVLQYPKCVSYVTCWFWVLVPACDRRMAVGVLL